MAEPSSVDGSALAKLQLMCSGYNVLQVGARCASPQTAACENALLRLCKKSRRSFMNCRKFQMPVLSVTPFKKSYLKNRGQLGWQDPQSSLSKLC